MRWKMKRKPSMDCIYPSLITTLCCGLLICLSPQTATGTGDERPLVLQYQVSHPRNTDQVSLIFRQKTVELVVNTDFWQEETMPRRLGHFVAFYNWELSHLKRRLEHYHRSFTGTVSLLSLIDIPDLPSMREPAPHAPSISIGGEEVPSRHDHYEALFGIIRSVWDHRWVCYVCASYRIQGDSIVRTMEDPFRAIISSPDARRSNVIDEFSQPRRFEESIEVPRVSGTWVSGSGESLDCIRTGHDGTRMECLDSGFGLFELPVPVQDTSSASGP